MMLDEINAETIARRKKKADYMREYGRRHGAVPVKGTTFVCERCERIFPRTSVRQKWCAKCKPAALIEFKRVKRLEAGHVAIGTQIQCRTCDRLIVKEHKRQFHCAACSEESRFERLPHQLERRNKRIAKFNRERRRNNPKWAIHARMSAGILQSLRDGKGGRHWESLVGYTVEDLMKHLERQFPKGMTWGRRSEFHIDHIIPLASFSFETADDPEFKAAWSLTNLRPMWATDNIKKSAQRLHLL